MTSLTERVNAWLATRGHTEEARASHNDTTGAYVVTVFARPGDPGGPYIAHFGSGLGDWPTTADGFTAQELRARPT